jgi:uncharacterized protein (UPF0248 family)
MQVNNISAKQVYKSTQENDIWAYVILDINKNPPNNTGSIPIADNDDIQLLLHQYADVFNDLETPHHHVVMIMQSLYIQWQSQLTLNLSTTLHNIR